MSNAGAGAGAGDPLTNLLCDLARADGIHDFGTEAGPDNREEGGRRDGRNEAFTKSVPGESTHQWDEPSSLANVFTETGFRATLENAIKEATKNAPPPPGGVEIGTFLTHAGGEPFRVKAVPFKGVSQTGATLVDNLFGASGFEERVVLQVDFNHHGFLTSLRGNPAGPTVRKIGYMWSAATVNDPASKTDPSESVFNPGGEVEFVVHKQTSGPTIFTGGSLYSPTDYTRNFMSKYDIELSGIETKGIFGKKQKSNVSIKFQYGAQTALISDSKGQNAKDQLKPFIFKIVRKIADAGGQSLQKLQFELATKWMQKRSGDWLQALHAKLYRDLTFEPPIAPVGVDPFFVSHDQIAIAYALMMRIPSLYFFSYPYGNTRVDYAVVFDNRVPSEEERNAREEYCNKQLADNNGRVEALNTWYNKLKTNRTNKQQVYNEQVTAGLTRLKAGTPIPYADMQNTLRDVFKSAVLYVFVELLVPTIENPTNEEVLACTRYSAYQTLGRMFDQHKASNADDSEIPQLMIDKFKASKVFKTIDTWTLEYTGTENTRMKKPVGQNKPDDERDTFAFLAYIANSRDDVFKNNLATSFKQIQDWFFGPSFADNLAGLTPDREPTESRKQRLTRGIRDILTQGYVYLKPTSQPTDPGEWTAIQDSIQKVSVEDTTAPGENGVNEPVRSLFQRLKLFVSRLLFGPARVPDRVGPSGRLSRATPTEDAKAEDEEADAEPTLGQTGGWRDGARPVDRQDLDTRQITDPPLHALIEAGVLTLAGSIEAAAVAETRVDVEPTEVEGLVSETAGAFPQPGEREATFISPPSSRTSSGDTSGAMSEDSGRDLAVTGSAGAGSGDADVVMSTGPAPSDKKRKYEDVTKTPTRVSTGLKSSSSVVQPPKVIKANPTPADKVEFLIDAGWIPDATGAGGGAGWTSPTTGVHYNTLDEAWTAYEPTLQSGGGNDPLASKGWTQQREGIWRDPLTLLDYTTDVARGFQKARDGQKGGAADTEKVTLEDPAVRDVLESLLLLAADQIVVDTDDMAEAVDSQREYYTRGVDLLEAIGKEGQSRVLALATYDLLCRSRWIPTEVFQASLGIDTAYEAETLKLFFSNLFSYSFMKAPEIKFMYLAELEGLYATIKPNPIKSTAEIRATAEGILTRVLKLNGIQYPPPPVEKGVVKPDLTAGPSGEEPTDVLNTSLTRGQTQDPGALEKSFSSPSSQSGGKRRPLFTTP